MTTRLINSLMTDRSYFYKLNTKIIQMKVSLNDCIACVGSCQPTFSPDIGYSFRYVYTTLDIFGLLSYELNLWEK